MESKGYLAHYGIKGQHWGIRRGPPYPLSQVHQTAGALVKKTRDKSTTDVDTEKVVHSLRNVAIASLGAAAVIGAAYMAKKSGIFSKLRVSDLSTISEIKFVEDDGKRMVKQLVFNPLSFQAARNRYRDCLKKMDEIVFPDGKKSLLDNNMEAEEATLAVSKAIGVRMRQGTESSDLIAFCQAVSEGKVSVPEAEFPSYRTIINLIDSNHEVFDNVLQTGRDFGDLKNKEAKEVLEIVRNLAEIYRNDR